MSNGRLEVLRNEVRVAPISLGPRRFECQVADQAALVERDSGDDGDLVLSTGREELVLGRPLEDVVYDLDGIDQARSDSTDAVPRLPPIQADAERSDRAFALEFGDGLRQLAAGQPIVLPDVELKK